MDKNNKGGCNRNGGYMPIVKTGNYEGSDRRNGNGRLKLTLGEYIKLFTMIVAIFAGGVAGWVTIRGNVSVNAQEIAEASEERKDIKKAMFMQQENITKLQSTTERTQKDVKDIKVIQEENTKVLYKILGKLE